eukprot:m.304198 g.304198  ORF g.304198 m.304198 type:complete len:1144 (+) comp15896_c0_seq2:757-4188(+)
MNFGQSPVMQHSALNDGPELCRWVCIQTDHQHTMIGRCGDDDPSVCIPTNSNLSVPACVQRGSIRDFDNLRSLWQRGLKHLDITIQNPHSIVTMAPIFSTRRNITTLVSLLFQQLKAPSLFLTNPWIAALMSNGAVSGIVIHADEQAACVAPVVKMKVVEKGLFRLPFGSADLKNPQVLHILFKSVFHCILHCPEHIRPTLWNRIILSGAFPDNFDAALEANLAACLKQSVGPVKVHVDASGADGKMSTWIGLSIIGSLSTAVHEKPIIEDGAIGAYMTLEQFKQYGPDYIFAGEQNTSSVLCPVGQGIGNIVSDAEIERIACDPDWQAEDQYVCIHTDLWKTIGGRCGDDMPIVSIPTDGSNSYSGDDTLASRGQRQPVVDGAIADWAKVTLTWKKVLEYLDVHPGSNHGIVMSLPIRTSRGDIEMITRIVFEELKAPALFLCNPWCAVLMASGYETGIIVATENTCTCIAPMIGMRVLEDAMIRIPIMDTDLYDQDICLKIYQAIHDCILAAPQEHWATLWANIILSGGCIAQEEFVENLEAEVFRLAVNDPKVKSDRSEPDVVAITFFGETQGSTWIGISILGALVRDVQACPRIEDQPVGVWITREMYTEHGAAYAFKDACDGFVITVAKRPTMDSTTRKQKLEYQPSKASLISIPTIQLQGTMEMHQGWLVKQGGGTTLLSRKNWKRRWFILQGNQLTYHKNNFYIVSHPPAEVRQHATGTIDVSQATAIDPWEGKTFGFVIITPTRTFYIHATSTEEQKVWLRKLRAARDAAKGDPTVDASSSTSKSKSKAKSKSSPLQSSSKAVPVRSQSTEDAADMHRLQRERSKSATISAHEAAKHADADIRTRSSSHGKPGAMRDAAASFDTPPRLPRRMRALSRTTETAEEAMAAVRSGSVSSQGFHTTPVRDPTGSSRTVESYSSGGSVPKPVQAAMLSDEASSSRRGSHSVPDFKQYDNMVPVTQATAQQPHRASSANSELKMWHRQQQQQLHTLQQRQQQVSTQHQRRASPVSMQGGGTTPPGHSSHPRHAGNPSQMQTRPQVQQQVTTTTTETGTSERHSDQQKPHYLHSQVQAVRKYSQGHPRAVTISSGRPSLVERPRFPKLSLELGSVPNSARPSWTAEDSTAPRKRSGIKSSMV